jgi:hypothetical protein
MSGSAKKKGTGPKFFEVASSPARAHNTIKIILLLLIQYITKNYSYNSETMSG